MVAENATVLRISTSELSWWRTLSAVSSGAVLALAYLNSSWFSLCWFAFVPLLFAIDKQSIAASYCYGFIAGLAFYMSAAHWIIEFLMLFKGYDQTSSFSMAIVFWIYCAQLPALLAASFTWLKRWTGVSSLVLFPLLVVFFYAAFPMLFSVQLGASQSGFLIALQGIEWTGVYGLDFVIGLSNIGLFLLLRRGRESLQTPGLMAVGFLIAAWFAYGAFSLSQWDEKIAGWSKRSIGLVQPNQAPTLKSPGAFPGYSHAYPPQMDMTERLAAAGAELVIWPEAQYQGYFDKPTIREAFSNEVAQLGVALLFQDMESEGLPSADAENSLENDAHTLYNSVAFLSSDGSHQNTYRKIKRVAFGETLPLMDWFPWGKRWIENYLGTFFRETSAGDGAVVFDSAGLQIVPLICYETLFPIFTARAMPEQPNGALLVGVSNDGWFGNTRQPHQHANASALRAVETRAPMVHVLNNGPSLAVMPNGRVVYQSKLGEAGGFIVDLPHSRSSGGSFFSHHPSWFIGTVYVALVVLLLSGLWRRTTGRSAKYL